MLNLILADVYGPQKLLGEGLLPPDFVFAHAGFLRPCHHIHVPHQTYLHLYASHLARSADDGRWLVLADRTQTPSGAGYAVENRIVISRMLPNKFRDCRVQRLASFFIAVREMLHGLAAQHRDNPRIVLLSPGSQSPTYFEDAYLARYLGYTLVEGGDLTVRNGRVYVKTLAGSFRPTWFFAGYPTTDAIRSNFAATRSRAFPDYCRRCAAAAWRSRTRWEAACSRPRRS